MYRGKLVEDKLRKRLQGIVVPELIQVEALAKTKLILKTKEDYLYFEATNLLKSMDSKGMNQNMMFSRAYIGNCLVISDKNDYLNKVTS